MQAAFRLLGTMTENPDYWGFTCAGCLIMAKDTGRFLMPLRSPEVSDPNCWGTWGGAVDHGEHIPMGVRREVSEEAGYKGESAMYPLYVFRNPDGNMVYYNFLMVVPHEFQPVLNWETAKAVWLPFNDIPEPMHPGLKALLNDDPSIKTIKYHAKESGENYPKHVIEE
jgi:8-oxo-dGTP pyrophosphatase MutT (NUDIX family)